MLASQKFIKLRISAYKKLKGMVLPRYIGMDTLSHSSINMANLSVTDLGIRLSATERYAVRRDFYYYFPNGIISFLKENIPENEHEFLDWKKPYLERYFKMFIFWRIKQLELYLENTKKCNTVIRNQRK